MDAKSAKSNVTLVGALHIGFGTLTLLGAVVTFIILRFSTGFIEGHDDIGLRVMQFITTFVPFTMLIFGGIDLLAGIAIFSYKQWARVLMLVISALNCLNIPIGTAKGVYSIWVMMQPEVMEMFE